ncbi:substrate-binding domain-containing protein [Mycoplasmatota bacterium]|nr:substrate-binding domain-containing protein [Mycoplasmatota bacterium]
MRKILVVLLVLLMVGCQKEEKLMIATTTSLDNSGLLAYLLPHFEEETGVKISVVAVGTGAALELGRNKDADILLVHAKEQEIEFVESGYGEKRADIMYNDFIFVGAEKIDSTNLTETLNFIKDNLEFYSRGDNSGTHMKELSLWDSIDYTPSGDWYKETGQSMGSTLNMANLAGGYTFTDRGTYLSMIDNLDLVIAYENTVELLNQYGVIKVTDAENSKVAEEFYNWILTSEAKELVSAFRKYNEQLFYVE